MSRQRILVLDDDEEFLLYLQTALISAGYEVSPAASAADAVAQLHEGRFALVLADMRLPGASGLDVLAEARKLDALTVGIVVTGHGSVDNALVSLREGVFDYLVKPCLPDQLLASVRRGLEHHELLRALVEKTAQLESQERMIQDVSHELKNPLSVVYGYSSFLLKKDRELQSEEVQKSLRSIHSNAERLGRLLEELNESSRLQGGKLALERSSHSARALCQEAVDNFAPQAVLRAVSLTLAPGGDEHVHADAKRVHQVLSNLIANGLKFTPKGGAISISYRQAGQCVEFSVSDTGCGIPENALAHLFDRFYQVEKTRQEHPGLGLGLEISKGLVELHGGKIWARNQAAGGAVLSFTLPACAPLQKPATLPASN